MYLQRFLPHLIILLAVLAVMSCTDDWLRSEYDMTVKWEGGYEGPLIFGDLSLKDLLEEFDSTGYVFEDSTGFLYAAYSKDTTLTGPDMLEIKDQKFIQVFFRPETDIPGELLEDTVLVQNKGFKFERTGDERLDSVYVKDGQMRIYVRSTIKHMGNLNISSDQVFLNGEKYDTTIVISDATGTFEQTVPIPLAGGKIYLNNSVPDSSSLYIRFEYELISSGEDIRTTEEVQIINSFHNMEFSAAYGTVGLWDSLLINQAELEFDLLEGAFEGTIKLADPQLNIRTDNSIGVPFDIELLDFEAFFQRRQ